MIVDALRHATDALDYLQFLRNQSVFNFVAIPVTMAMATLELCFMNPNMFQRNIKIRKAEAASLIMRSTNPRDVAYIFRDYARKIHAKALPADPNFLRVSVACGKIEQWCEKQYPSFIQIVKSPTGELKQIVDSNDARARIWADNEKIGYSNGAMNGANGCHTLVRPPDAASRIKSVLLLLSVICLIVVYGALYLTREDGRW